MPRQKTNLRYIASDYVRRITMKKRCKGIIKKTAELSTLCDIPACVVIYEPGEAQPAVWPEEEQARRILQDFKSLPEMQQRRKMLNREDVLKKCNGQMDEKIVRQTQETEDLEMTGLLNMALAGMSLDDLDLDQARDLTHVIDMKTAAVRERLKRLNAETALTAAGQGKGKAPMNTGVAVHDQLETLMEAPMNTGVSVHNQLETLMEAPMDSVTASAHNNCWLTSVAVQEWLEKEKADKAITLPAMDEWNAPMYPEPTAASTHPSCSSIDPPVLDKQTTILDEMDDFDFNGLDDDWLDSMGPGTPRGDSGDSSFF